MSSTQATAASPAAGCEQVEPRVQREQWIKVLGGAEMFGNTVGFVVRAGAAAFLVMLWSSACETRSYYGAEMVMRSVLGIGAMGLCSAGLLQVLLVHLRRPLTSAVVGTAVLTLWSALCAAAQSWWTWRERWEAIRDNAPVLMVGGLVGAVLFPRLWRWIGLPARAAELSVSLNDADAGDVDSPWMPSVGLRSIRSCRGCGETLDAQTGNACACGDEQVSCPKCGRENHVGKWRVELERLLARGERTLGFWLAAGRAWGVLTLVTVIVEQFAMLSSGSRVVEPWLALLAWGCMYAVVGGLLGLALVHWRSRWKAMALSIAMVLVAVLLGLCVMRSAGPSMRMVVVAWIVAAVLTGVAGGFWLVTLFVPLIVQKILPRTLQVHLLYEPRVPESTTKPGLSSIRCENCWYQLEGLPATRCEACGEYHVRCPECGYVQGSDVQHAIAVRWLQRGHIAVRVLSTVNRLFWLCLFGAAVIAMSVETIGTGTRQSSTTEILEIALVALFVVVPIRMLLLRFRPIILGSAITMGLLIAATTITATFASFVTRGNWEPYWRFVRTAYPIWAAACLITPLLWRVWVWVLLPGEVGQRVYDWFTRRVYRRSDGATRLAKAKLRAGEAMELHCRHCGQELTAQAPAACSCGGYRVICSTCGGQTGISATRLSVEAFAQRAVHMILAGGIGSCAIAAALMVIALMGATQWTIWDQPDTVGLAPRTASAWQHAGQMALTGVSVGILLGWMLTRRYRLWILLLATGSTGAVLLGFLAIKAWPVRVWEVTVAAMAMCIPILIGTLLAGVLLRACIWLLLPADARSSVMAGIRGQQCAGEVR